MSVNRARQVMLVMAAVARHRAQLVVPLLRVRAFVQNAMQAGTLAREAPLAQNVSRARSQALAVLLAHLVQQ